MTGCAGHLRMGRCPWRSATPCNLSPLCGSGGDMVQRRYKDITMKDHKELPGDLISPVVKPNEVRQRMRKLENALHSASEAIREAREEYQYLVYGVGDKTKSKH